MFRGNINKSSSIYLREVLLGKICLNVLDSKNYLNRYSRMTHRKSYRQPEFLFVKIVFERKEAIISNYLSYIHDFVNK